MLIPSSGDPVPVPEIIELPAFDPVNDGETTVFIRRRVLERLKNNIQRISKQRFLDARLIPEALEKPTAIFEGLQRFDGENGRCYCCIPEKRKRIDRTVAAAPLGKVFLVFLKGEATGLFVFNWGWRTKDFFAEGCPHGWQNDFGRKLWPRET